MNELLQNLIKLQSIEFGTTGDKTTEAAKAELRARIPSQILAHYDRLVARGKKGIAIVRDQVCTACHMRLPIGVIMTLMHGQDIQLCESCGRYLCLSPAAKTEVTEAANGPKPKKKTRKTKKPLQAI
jgi:C4-type zinc ribbon domain